MISRVEVHTLVDGSSNVGTEKAVTKCARFRLETLENRLGQDVNFF